MARSSLVAALLLPLALAGGQEKMHVQTPGQPDLAYTEIVGLDNFASNVTAGIENHLAGSWYDAKLCASGYCVYGNRQAAGGRGIALVTTAENMQRVKRLEPVLRVAENNGPADVANPAFEEREIPGRGLTLVAARPLRRGDRILSATPALVVHKKFYEEVGEEEQGPLLAAAVQLLPGPTRQKFQDQVRTANAGSIRDIRHVVRRLSFESNLGYKFTPADTDSERHYVVYPEATAMPHDCRANVAYYIDGGHVHRTTAARRIEAGEPLTLAYLNPLQTHDDRQEIVQGWRGTPCTCSQCTGDGVKKSDNRVREIQMIEKILKDPESQGVTTDMMARLVELYKAERLEARFSDMYELVALNYNNLGYTKRASKYALLAAQAGAVERGADANDIIAMRILAKDPEGHYSYRARVKGSK